jgi:hypothetical protein
MRQCGEWERKRQSHPDDRRAWHACKTCDAGTRACTRGSPRSKERRKKQRQRAQHHHRQQRRDESHPSRRGGVAALALTARIELASASPWQQCLPGMTITGLAAFGRALYQPPLKGASALSTPSRCAYTPPELTENCQRVSTP